MRYYLTVAAFIFIAIFTISVPALFSSSLDSLFSKNKIPANNSAVAGIQKYNTPPQARGFPIPLTTARSVLIRDLGTGTILYQKDASARVPIASTTKIMTALVANGHFKPSSVLTVNKGAAVGGSSAGLVKGEEMSFRSLLYGMLLNSGNDASFAIAENFPGGVEEFVAAMNRKAQDLGLQDTNFDNPAGFDNPKHFSSASDLAEIAQEALKNAQLARIFATKDTEVVSWDKRYKHRLSNLNKLLSKVHGVLGVKTGYTKEAKENLVTLVEREGHRLLLVVLGSDDRFGETENLIEWAYGNFVWPNAEIVQRSP